MGAAHRHAEIEETRYDDAIMMVRMQVTLDSELQKRAKERAAQLGISLAELVRRLVQRDLGETPASVDVSLVCKLGRSDGSDIARRKDEMLGEATARADHP
jgi:hypothetical protein